MNRVLWHCGLCLGAGSPLSILRFAGLTRREIGGEVRSCALWRCPAGHEHYRLHERIGSSYQPAAGGPLWAGAPIQARLTPVERRELTRAQQEEDAARQRTRERATRAAWTGPPRPVRVESIRIPPVILRPVAGFPLPRT